MHGYKWPINSTRTRRFERSGKSDAVLSFAGALGGADGSLTLGGGKGALAFDACGGATFSIG